MSTIFRTVFGSHMYGLNTPTSDKDYKEVFIPSFRSMLLKGPVQHYVHSTALNSEKNTKDDVDNENLSLAKFVQLAAKGEMLCVDMLHSPKHLWEVSTPAWEKLYANRDVFYTKDMRAYLGYIRKQVTTYGVKGERLEALTKVIDHLSKFDKDLKLKDVMSTLPLDDNYLFMREAPGANGVMMHFYEVCGRQHQETVRLFHILEALRGLQREYGHRAKSAMDAGGVDWKAVSHGFRAAYQLTSLYRDGTFSYPLPESAFIRDVKLGLLPFESLQPKLEELFELVNELAPKSGFPEKIDQDKIDALTIDLYYHHFGQDLVELLSRDK